MSNIAAASNNSASANYFTFDHINKKIVGSEFNFKLSGNPEKPQYKALMTAMARHSDYTLSPITSKKKVEKKQTYAGLTSVLIKEYVALFGTEEQKIAHAEMVEAKFPYPTIKSWFLEENKGFSVSKAKRDIANGKLHNKKITIRTTVKAKVKAPTTVVEMPNASNF